MITEYDPNIHWARHTIELTFMQWNYCIKIQTEILGNVTGADLFEGAVRNCFDKLYDQTVGDYAQIILKRAGPGPEYAEDELEVSLDEDDLMQICVGVCIIKHEAEERK
jgi:hypothetical protein